MPNVRSSDAGARASAHCYHVRGGARAARPRCKRAGRPRGIADDQAFRCGRCRAWLRGRAIELHSDCARGDRQMTELAELTLAEIASAIRARKASSVEATRALLARIEQWQPALNAFVRLDAEAALGAAAAADAALAGGNAKGALHGVPLAHKDMFYVAGKFAECGSKLRKGFIAPATSTAVARLDQAGTIRLGALHMAEFAYGPTGHNAHLGPAHNPWDQTRITGGSSSGSGAAVGARLGYAALGSDTGGSIRLPAHFCGISGLKPTYGRVSRANAMPLSFSLDSVGPLARTAEDCSLILSEIAGPDP